MTLPVHWNLQNIGRTARQVSGQLDVNQLPNSELYFFINSYYQYDLPRELKIEELYDQYTFPTQPNIATYTLPGDFASGVAYTNVIPKIYLNGLPIFYTQDTDVYYSRTSPLFATELMGTGAPPQTTFTFTTNFKPIVPEQIASVNIVQQLNGVVVGETFSDNGAGILISSTGGIGTGTVNYLTGAISVTFSTPPPVDVTIFVTYHYQQIGSPNTCLFYDRQFTFFPTPDTVYQVRIDACFQPFRLEEPTDEPIKNEWGEIIAIGAALKILRNFGQYDKYQEAMIYYKKERSKLMSDTDNQLMASRSKPMC